MSFTREKENNNHENKHKNKHKNKHEKKHNNKHDNKHENKHENENENFFSLPLSLLRIYSHSLHPSFTLAHYIPPSHSPTTSLLHTRSLHPSFTLARSPSKVPSLAD